MKSWASTDNVSGIGGGSPLPILNNACICQYYNNYKIYKQRIKIYFLFVFFFFFSNVPLPSESMEFFLLTSPTQCNQDSIYQLQVHTRCFFDSQPEDTFVNCHPITFVSSHYMVVVCKLSSNVLI